MPNSDHHLFSLEDAFSKLEKNREQGCLLVYKGAELIHIYVRDGFVIHAYGSTKEGDEAVEQAMHLSNASYTWLRGIQPPAPAKSPVRHINKFLAKDGKPKMIETSRLAVKVQNEDEAIYRYFLIPQDKLTEKIYLNKTSTVLGRNETSDVVIANSDVSGRHCLLDIQTRGISILDLDSTNGTFVNGTLVRDAFLNPGDRIELGPCVFVINREALNKP